MDRKLAEKQFDCVQFMRKARERLSVEIAGMSPDEVMQRFNSRQYAYPWSSDAGDPARKSADNTSAHKRPA